MEQEPSSGLLVVPVRTLIQGGVVFVFSVALWLIGIGFEKNAPRQVATPQWTATAANVRWAQSPPASPTRWAAERALSKHKPTSIPLKVIVPQTVNPTAWKRDDDSAQARVPVTDTPPVLLPAPTRTPEPSATPPSQVQVGGGDVHQESLDQVGGIVVFDVFVPFTPTPEQPAVVPQAPETAPRWVWPVRGEISQGYSSGHRAIDISTGHGAIVRAVDAGRVVYDRWETSGYGYLVIIDHGDGYLSYYGHLYGYYVEAGQEVARGEQIGELGTTGRSTGPHLHFEIRQDGVQRNPLDLLP